MPVGLSDFRDLLEEYFAVKNAPETEQGNKKNKLDDIKMEIYDSYLNEDFERNSNVSPAESTVMEKFFIIVDNYEREYMVSGRFSNAELGNISNGLALQCAIEFTQNFVDYDLLKDEIKEELLRAYKKKKYKKKSKKKSKKKKSKKRISKKRKNKKSKSKKW
jgi:glycogen synthase